MRLVENWKQAWRMFSVQAFAILIGLPAAWEVIPDDVKAMLPENALKWTMVVVAIAGAVGRLIDQPKVGKP